jgi:hypothetical protein
VPQVEGSVGGLEERGREEVEEYEVNNEAGKSIEKMWKAKSP